MQHTAVHISKPCLEHWDAMTPAGPGRLCAACQKVVVDFTQKTDVEILAYFRHNRGSTCGRFNWSQVARPLVTGRPGSAPRHWQGWLTGLLAVALTTQSCHTITGEPAPSHQVSPLAFIADSATVEAAPYPTPISGRVVDQYTQQPVGSVRVHLKNTAFSTVTDSNGLFAFPEAATALLVTHRDPSVLQLLATGYPACESVLDYALPPPNQPLLVVSVSLPVPEYLMGDVEELR